MFTLHRNVSFAYQLLIYFWMALASFRLTRLVTTDVWPPIVWLRSHLIDFTTRRTKRTGPSSHWPELFTCPWCAGAYLTAIVFGLTWLFVTIPLPLLQYSSLLAIVGYLGVYDER